MERSVEDVVVVDRAAAEVVAAAAAAVGDNSNMIQNPTKSKQLILPNSLAKNWRRKKPEKSRSTKMPTICLVPVIVIQIRKFEII
jgi:hypothetical protein